MTDVSLAFAEMHQLLERSLAIADSQGDTHLAALLDEALQVVQDRISAVRDEANAS
jgi:hypothetical protein